MIRKATLNLLEKHLNNTSRLVVRTDFNVPIIDGRVSDLNRIKSTIPTLQHLLKYDPKSIVLLSHLGRPNGKINPNLSLRPIVNPLQQLLGRPVTFLQNCLGDSIVKQVNNAQGEIFLCQNVRFHPQQEGGFRNPQGKKILCNFQEIQNFRRELSRLGNIYVNDAFGSAHRAHSSVVGLKHQYKVAGLLMQKELQNIGGFLQNAKKPVLVILGGSKVTDKLQLIMNMLNVANELIIGGGMSGPFLKELYGYKLGSTKIIMPEDPTMIRRIIDKAKQKGINIHLPFDGVCSQTFSPTAPTRVFANKDIPQGWEVFDKGSKTIEAFDQVVQRANSIFWNGPVGVFEFPNFKHGSESLMRSVAARTSKGAVSIIGGGDTGSLVNNMGLADKVSYVSTGGGATLQFMQGRLMPGVQALSDSAQLNLKSR